jgi:hypothetical protein
MGILGQMVQPFIVQPKLNEIFECCKKKIVSYSEKFK